MSDWTRPIQEKSVYGGTMISMPKRDPEPEALTNLRTNLNNIIGKSLEAFNNDNWQKAQNITNQALDTQSSLLGQLGGSNGLLAQNQNLANQLANIAQTGNIPSTISNALNDSVNKGLQSSMGTMLNNLGKRGILNSSVTTAGTNQLSQAAADSYNRNYLNAYQTVLSGLGSSLQAGQNNVASLLSALGAAGSAPSNAYEGISAGINPAYNDWKNWRTLYQSDDPYETIYNQKAQEADSCITGDTLITLEDGREIPVAELKDDDKIKVWDFVNGCMTSAPLTAFFKSKYNDGLDVVRVEFEDGSNVGVIFEHLFFDLTEGKFIAINSDSQEYVGHEFAKVSKDGKVTPVKVSRIFKDGKATETFGPQAVGYLNYLAGGFISGNDGQLGICNRFEFDTENMRFNPEQREADLEKYGRLEYEMLREILSEEFFYANHCDEFGVAFGKGLISAEDFKGYMKKFAGCFFDERGGE